MEKYPAIFATFGHPLIWLNRIAIQPFSGRVMGLYPTLGCNALWVNPALKSEAAAAALMDGAAWTNLGGDRTWLSPEIELFIKDISRPRETYHPPVAFDPGSYHVLSQNDCAVELETNMKVDFYRTGTCESFRLYKRITTLNEPDFPLPSGISFVGYELCCTLTALSPLSPAVRPAIWNLLQVPGGGEIIVPVMPGAKPVNFFGRVQYCHDNNNIRATVPGALNAYKFGLRPESSLGITLYLNLMAPEPFLILRRFHVGHANDYFDVPYTMPNQPGCVQEIYVDNGIHGGFGEMEHHSPALLPGNNNVTDICTTWAFSGSIKQLNALIEIITQKQI
jgi:hypothetical protein